MNAPLSVPDAIRTRRATRHYLPDPVPADVLDELLDLTLIAPSSWNLRQRSIVVVTSDERRQGLTWASDGQPHAEEAPVMLVFVAETSTRARDIDDVVASGAAAGAWSAEFRDVFATQAPAFQADLAERGLAREYAVKGVMIAATHLMLAAASLGLATGPMDGWDELKVKKIVGIDDRDDLAIAVLVALGFPAEHRTSPGRQEQSRHLFGERYGASFERGR